MAFDVSSEWKCRRAGSNNGTSCHRAITGSNRLNADAPLPSKLNLPSLKSRITESSSRAFATSALLMSSRIFAGSPATSDSRVKPEWVASTRTSTSP